MTDHHHKIFNANDYVPKRFGLNFSPPQIIIEYLSPSSGKLYHHLMRLHKFSKTKSNAEIMKELYERHQMYLDKKKVSSEQLIRLIEKLKENFVPRKKKSNAKDSTTATTTTIPKPTPVKQEIKEIPKKEIPPKKEEKKEDEIEEDFDLEDLTDELDKKEEKPKEKPKEPEVKKEKKKEDDELEEEEDEYGGFDDVDEDEDLNKLDDSALNRKKKEMDIVYEKNNIKVGDEDFKYDVRKEFDHEKYAAEWDDDSY